MAFQYRNRRGDIYLLQAGKTVKGKPRYYFGRKLTGTAVDEIPDGYEVFESPERAQVYLRKVRATAIKPLEREIVTEGIRRLSAVEHFVVDVEQDCLVVYTPSQQGSTLDDLVLELAGPFALLRPDLQAARDQMVTESDYDKLLRFELKDESRRLFCVQRWCFRGSMDHWMFLSGPAELSDLVEQYAEYLGSEDFYELM